MYSGDSDVIFWWFSKTINFYAVDVNGPFDFSDMIDDGAY